MQEFKFNVTGADRKKLAGAISEILNTPMNYLGAPTFSYSIGDYSIDKNGSVTGEYNQTLFTELAGRGFEPETATTEESQPDRLAIEMPLDGFTPDSIENLCKMVKAKENLLMAALGADDLPIQVLEDRIRFPWFPLTDDAERVNAYAQLISALCTTAKEKKRVTAKAQGGFENEKFAMRVWLIGLGCVGAEYKYLRKIMGEFLGGNSAWRHGKPEQAIPTVEAPAAEESEVEGDE